MACVLAVIFTTYEISFAQSGNLAGLPRGKGILYGPDQESCSRQVRWASRASQMAETEFYCMSNEQEKSFKNSFHLTVS